jgi:hypothetical protein
MIFGTFSFFCEILLHKYHIDSKQVRVYHSRICQQTSFLAMAISKYGHNTNIFVIFFFKIEMFDLHAVSIFFSQAQVNQTPPPPFFASCGTQFIEE